MEKILVIGGAGFIGSALVDTLIQLHYDVTVFDSLTPAIHPDGKPPAHLNRKATLIKGNANDYNHLKRVIKDKSRILYLASITNRYTSSHLKNTVENNCNGIINVLDILSYSEHCCSQLILGSSILCSLEPESNYPTPQNIDEYLDCYASHNTLFLTQKMRDTLVTDFANAFRFPTLILRYGLVFGPHQNLTDNVIGVFACFLMQNQPPLIYENGLPKRDFIHIDHAVKQTIDAIHSHTLGCTITPVISGRTLSIRQVAHIMTNIFNKDIKPHRTNKKRPHDFSNINWNDLYKKFNIEPQKNILFEKDMETFVDWLTSKEANTKYQFASKILKKHHIL